MGNKDLTDGILYRNTTTRNKPRKKEQKLLQGQCKIEMTMLLLFDFLSWPFSVTRTVVYFSAEAEEKSALFCWRGCKLMF